MNNPQKADGSKRVAIYARTATSQGVGNLTLGSQIEQCQAYTQECGYTVGHTYREIWDGAADPRTSPVVLALLGAAHRQEFERIILISFDRFSWMLTMLSELADLGIAVEDVRGETARSLLQTIAQGVAERKRARMAERIKHGKAVKKATHDR